MIKKRLRYGLLISFFVVHSGGGAQEQIPPEVQADIEQIVIQKYKATGAAVAVLDQGKAMVGTYGTKSYDSKDKVNLDTYFRIGSVSKILTTLGALKLQEQGQLQLTDLLKTHLPWFAVTSNPQWSNEITIQHLLSHTSGISREFGCVFSKSNGDWIPMRSLPDCVNNRELNFAPGAELKYSNLGINLIGAIIAAKKSGDSNTTDALTGYSEYMVREILRPLGMPNAKYYLTMEDFNNTAQGYGVIEQPTGKRRPVKLAHGALANTPSYYLAMTAKDLPALLLVLRSVAKSTDVAILKAATLRQMFNKRMKDRYSNYEYGLGLTIIPDTNGRFLIGHSGGAPGYRTYVIYDTANDVGVAALVNTHDNAARDIVDLLLKKWTATHQGIVGLKDTSVGVDSTKDLGGPFSGKFEMWARSLQIFTVGFDLQLQRPELDIFYDGKRRHLNPIENEPMKYRIPVEGPYNDAKGEVLTFIPSEGSSPNQMIFADGYDFDRVLAE